MQQVFLSDTELYFWENVNGNTIEISGEEFHHIKDVMRHKEGDEIFITNGKGVIYKTKINLIEKKLLSADIAASILYANELSNVTFCIPRLKSADRFEFALEKCVELGITNFIVFDSNRTVAKGEKLYRWEKILISAMKQSLRAWLPKVSYCKSINEIIALEGKKYFLYQNAESTLSNLFSNQSLLNSSLFFVFGPEGGFSNEESIVMSEENKVKLTENRLRSETAIVAAASVLASNLAR
ncbi:MAG: RsmE family RNA methyltransferase [Bacteroidota bacterium]